MSLYKQGVIGADFSNVVAKSSSTAPATAKPKTVLSKSSAIVQPPVPDEGSNKWLIMGAIAAGTLIAAVMVKK